MRASSCRAAPGGRRPGADLVFRKSPVADAQKPTPAVSTHPEIHPTSVLVAHGDPFTHVAGGPGACAPGLPNLSLPVIPECRARAPLQELESRGGSTAGDKARAREHRASEPQLLGLDASYRSLDFPGKPLLPFLQSAESEAVLFLNENTVQFILHETLQRSVPREPDSPGRSH